MGILSEAVASLPLHVYKYNESGGKEKAVNYPLYFLLHDEREPIEVRIENDRIEIVSFPGPDRSITLEGLKSYRVSNRRYRNRRIGDFLKELRLTEGRNTGFKKILDALTANGSPKPEFETDEDTIIILIGVRGRTVVDIRALFMRK